MKYAAVVLDLGLPDEDGLTLLRDMRRRRDATPVLVLTARDGVSDRVIGLREGADDYLPSRSPWRSWSRACRRCCGGPATCSAACSPSATSRSTPKAARSSSPAPPRAFPARETAVLEILLRRGGNVAPKRLFEDQLFGLSGEVGSNAVEVYVHRLRKMLGDAGATVKIHTVRGVGYLMAEEKARRDPLPVDRHAHRGVAHRGDRRDRRC